ncbi:MAG: hypothetical protein ABR520_11900 [Mycobacteriales bacterium]
MRSPRALAALAGTLTVVLALPASASIAPFGPPQQACGSANLPGRVKIAPLASGALWGASSCGAGIRIVSRAPGGAWRSTPAWSGDYGVAAVADDGATTFVVLRSPEDYDPAGTTLYVGKVPHGGRPSALTQLVGIGDTTEEASIVARDGRWWAFYSLTRSGRFPDDNEQGSATLHWRKTMGGAAEGSFPSDVRYVDTPSAALTASGVVLTFQRQYDVVGPRTLFLATATPDGVFQETNLGPVDYYRSSDVAHAGGRTFVAWTRNHAPVLRYETADGPRVFELPHRGDVGAILVAASGGHVFVATEETFSYQGGQTTRVYVRDVSSTGAVSATEVSAAAGRTNPHVRWVLDDLTAARGRATALVWTASTTLSFSQS